MKKPTTPKKATTKKAPTKKKSSVRSKADKIKIAEKILENYSKGEFTLESCCGEEGITSRTLNNWVDSISEISESFKKAKEQNGKAKKEGLRKKGVDGLERLVTGFFVDEEEVTEIRDRTGRISQTIKRTKKKYFAPNVTAIIFALKAIDPTTWDNQKEEEEETEKQVFIIGGKEISF